MIFFGGGHEIMPFNGMISMQSCRFILKPVNMFGVVLPRGPRAGGRARDIAEGPAGCAAVGLPRGGAAAGPACRGC